MITRDNIHRVVLDCYRRHYLVVTKPEELDRFVDNIVAGIGETRLANATGVRCRVTEDGTGLVIDLVEPQAAGK